MRHAETVTFGGSGLDRAAELRSDAQALNRAAADRKTRAVVLWRGKPLIDKARPASLLRLPLDHPMLGLDASDGPIRYSSEWFFLGREDGAARFAINLDQWEPEGQESPSGAFLDPTEQHHPKADSDAWVFAELRRVMTWLSPRDAELAATAKALQSWHETHGFCARCGAASVASTAGWQRDCPQCGAHHFPRTDPVVIMLITHGNSVLMGRSPGWPEGMYSLLAGFVEPGETLEAAVRREVFEEAGIRVGPVRYLSSQPWPFPASLMIGCAGEATSDEIRIDPNEIEDARWVTREEMMDVFAGRHDDLLPARKGAIAHFLLENWLADRLE